MLGAIWAAIIQGEAGVGIPDTPENIVIGHIGIYSGNRISLTWTPTEPTMSTRIYYPDVATLWQTRDPGASYVETGHFTGSGGSYFIVHTNGGLDSPIPLELSEN